MPHVGDVGEGRGSFKIPVWIRKVAKNTVLLATLGAVLGEIVAVYIQEA